MVNGDFVCVHHLSLSYFCISCFSVLIINSYQLKFCFLTHISNHPLLLLTFNLLTTTAFLFIQIGLNVIMWSGSLPIIMNTNNALAVQGATIINGNLFCLSWANFFSSWALLKLVIEQLHVMDQARAGNLEYLTPSREGYPPLIPLTPTRLAHVLLLLFTLVVMVAGTRSYMQQECKDWDRTLCQRLEFTLSVSVLSLMGLMTGWIVAYLYVLRPNTTNTRRAINGRSCLESPLLRLNLMGLLTLGWLFGAAFATFGKHAPGHAFGNLYVGNWSCFFASLYLLKKTLIEYLTEQQARSQRRRGGRQKSKHQSDDNDGDDDDDDDNHTDYTSSSPHHSPSMMDVHSSPEDKHKPQQQQQFRQRYHESPTVGLARNDIESPVVDTPLRSSVNSHRVSPKEQQVSSNSHSKSYRSAARQDATARTIDLAYGEEDIFVDEDLNGASLDPEFGAFDRNRSLKESWTERTASMEDFDDDAASVETTRRSHISSARTTPNTGSGSRASGSSSHLRSSSYHNRGSITEHLKPKTIPFFTEEDKRLSSSLHGTPSSSNARHKHNRFSEFSEDERV